MRPIRSFPWPCALAVALLAAALFPAPAALAADGGRVHGAVPGLGEAMLSPQFWIERLEAPDAVMLDRAAIDRQNAAMRATDRSIHDPLALPAALDRAAVTAWIESVSRPPSRPRYAAHGRLDAEALDALIDTLALDAVPTTVKPRHGLVVRRADLRAFPTAMRVFSHPGDTDIDRFQEDALFPGAAVAVLHTSRDGDWHFVVSERYAAWIADDAVALGQRALVEDYRARAASGLLVTGAGARTVYTPESPLVSELQLDMGVRVPRLEWPAHAPVNGQLATYGHVIELPVRASGGRLAFAPALLPRAADVPTEFLPHTRSTLIRQAFKFLGERYGWGHAYNARDCSGFVSEIYRSVGVLLPRNTSAQSVSPALDRIEVAPAISSAERLQLLRDADVGDMVFVPGHVMMIIGHVDGEPWVIHDTAGMHLEQAGTRIHLPINGVAVTPITPMLSDSGESMIDRITSIQRVR